MEKNDQIAASALPDILRQVATGNQAAFKQIYCCFYKRLYLFALAIVKTKETAEEIVEDVFIKVRLADILLLRAEAFNAKGDIGSAATLVNQVRARVGLLVTTAATPADMALAIEQERRLELAFEGHRWFDLLRTGRAIAVMNAEKDGNGNNLIYNVQTYQLLLPVPQTQLDLNPLLVQNQSY